MQVDTAVGMTEADFSRIKLQTQTLPVVAAAPGPGAGIVKRICGALEGLAQPLVG